MPSEQQQNLQLRDGLDVLRDQLPRRLWDPLYHFEKRNLAARTVEAGSGLTFGGAALASTQMRPTSRTAWHWRFERGGSLRPV